VRESKTETERYGERDGESVCEREKERERERDRESESESERERTERKSAHVIEKMNLR